MTETTSAAESPAPSASSRARAVIGRGGIVIPF